MAFPLARSHRPCSTIEPEVGRLPLLAADDEPTVFPLAADLPLDESTDRGGNPGRPGLTVRCMSMTRTPPAVHGTETDMHWAVPLESTTHPPPLTPRAAQALLKILLRAVDQRVDAPNGRE
jgi:hypothetical protein